MANSRDFTGKNRKFTGTKGIVIAKGTTGERVGSESGELRFNTTTELMEYYDGNQWKPIDAPPAISSISTSDAQGTNNILNADGSTLHTITITGGNFGIGVTVKFVGNTGTEYAAGNVTRVSNSSITCKTTASMGTTDDPYDVQVTNTSGLAALLEDAFSFNAAPVFATASGQIGTVYNGQVSSFSSTAATDAEGNTITYSIVSGSLPGSGLSLSSSTGLITGTLGGTPSLGNYPFVVRAATTEGNVERQFSIQVDPLPFVTASGGTESTVGSYKYHTFTSSSNLVVTAAGSSPQNTLEYLVVAGGGSGGSWYGAGGGAGGAIDSTATPTATTYTVTIGGGASTTSSGTPGNGTQGVASSFGPFASATGGGGGKGNTGGTGGSGGSGGGGGRSDGAGGAATSGQGSAGGAGGPGSSGEGGSGGGKSGAGGPGNVGDGGAVAGGAGINWKSLGTTYAGGGGNTPGAGGAGGGGNGGGPPGGSGSAGSINTGGGGGGAYSSGNGGAGGSGIVIIRYLVS